MKIRQVFFIRITICISLFTLFCCKSDNDSMDEQEIIIQQEEDEEEEVVYASIDFSNWKLTLTK